MLLHYRVRNNKIHCFIQLWNEQIKCFDLLIFETIDFKLNNYLILFEYVMRSLNTFTVLPQKFWNCYIIRSNSNFSFWSGNTIDNMNICPIEMSVDCLNKPQSYNPVSGRIKIVKRETKSLLYEIFVIYANFIASWTICILKFIESYIITSLKRSRISF